MKEFEFTFRTPAELVLRTLKLIVVAITMRNWEGNLGYELAKTLKDLQRTLSSVKSSIYLY